MAGDNGNNTVNNQATVSENAEQAKKTPSRNLVREFVTPFVEEKLSERGGASFYEQTVTSKWDISSDFLEYWKSRDEWNNLSAEEKTTLESMEKTLFLKEAVRIGAGIESKRSTLGKLIERDFELTSEQKESIAAEIESFSLTELTKHLNYRTSRKALISRLFPKKEEQPKEQDFDKQFETLFAKNRISLSESQKDAVYLLLTSPHVHEDDVQEILLLFHKLEEKQLLVQYFFPTITLGALQKMDILSEKQVRDYIRQSIDKKFIGRDFAIEEELIKHVDANDIILLTKLMPEPNLDILLAGPGKKVIAERIREANKEINEEFTQGNTLGLEPDEDGMLLPDFQKKLTALGIKNAHLFEVGSYVRGSAKDINGDIRTFHFAITDIDDDPVKNRANKGVGKQITVKNILTSDGSVDKNWKTKPGEPYSYSDVYELLKKSLKQGKKWTATEILPQETLDKEIQDGKLEEKVLRDDINTLADLNYALDALDESGKKYPIKKGSSLQVGAPNDPDFHVFQIKSINESKKPPTIVVSDGNSQEIMTFQEFFDNFESKKEAKRLPNLETPEDFLRAMQANAPQNSSFEGIVYDRKRGIFVPTGKENDENYPGILQFAGEKKTVTLHPDHTGGLVGWNTGEWIPWQKEDKNKGIKATSGKYKGKVNSYKAWWNALYAELVRLGAKPSIPDVPLTAPEVTNATKLHRHSGLLKKYLGNPSLHDMFTGAKSLVDFVKHKLEHGSKLESAKFQLALAKKLWFPEAKMRELRNQVHGNNRKLMEEMVKELTDLPTAERAREVEHILQNNGSHDYEIQAAVLAMLKKSGALYVGSALQKYQGTFIFFERITGQKYDPNSPLVKRLMEAVKDRWVPPREEFLIQSYVQWLGKSDGGYGCDWWLWWQVRWAWEEWIKNENEVWFKQAEQGFSVDQRLFTVYDKFRWGEVYQGIGAMKSVYGKGGTGPEMHLPAMYITLSGIPQTLHTNQTNDLYNQFKSEGHPYPALAFLHRESKVELFQRVVGILCEKDTGMRASYAEVTKHRNANDLGKTIDAIRSFWSKYGDILHKKLVMSQDPEILFRAQEGDKDCQEYLEHMQGFTHKLHFNKAEVEEGTYEYNHSSFVWNAEKFLEHNVQINQSSGVLNTHDVPTKMAWDSFIAAVKDVRNIRVTTDEEKNRAFQQKRFAEYYKAFNSILTNVPPDKFTNLQDQSYMKELVKLGFSVPTTQQEADFDTPAYKAQLEKDFNGYMNGGRTVSGEKEKVATSISGLIGK